MNFVWRVLQESNGCMAGVLLWDQGGLQWFQQCCHRPTDDGHCVLCFFGPRQSLDLGAVRGRGYLMGTCSLLFRRRIIKFRKVWWAKLFATLPLWIQIAVREALIGQDFFCVDKFRACVVIGHNMPQYVKFTSWISMVCMDVYVCFGFRLRVRDCQDWWLNMLMITKDCKTEENHGKSWNMHPSCWQYWLQDKPLNLHRRVYETKTIFLKQMPVRTQVNPRCEHVLGRQHALGWILRVTVFTICVALG